jgi:opacity protein-like surface antigen
MNAKTVLLSALASLLFLTSAFGQQRFEIGAYAGGQINGGVDLSTTLFHRIEVQNGVNYGITAGYLFGEHYGLEFQWNHNNAGTTAQPIAGGQSVKVFNLDTNQYMGNFLAHLTPQESKLRPFFLVGLGASALSTDRSGVAGSTRFSFAVGAGAKYNIAKHVGLRGQFRYSPTYLATTSTGGYWCDPFWGGCWVAGESHYLNQFDMSGGITFRF